MDRVSSHEVESPFKIFIRVGVYQSWLFHVNVLFYYLNSSYKSNFFILNDEKEQVDWTKIYVHLVLTHKKVLLFGILDYKLHLRYVHKTVFKLEHEATNSIFIFFPIDVFCIQLHIYAS